MLLRDPSLPTQLRRAVFIDRDGTISEEVGYVNHPSRYRVFPFSAAAIRLLNKSGWLAIVITNQAGVARGYFSEEIVTVVHEQLEDKLQKDGASLDGIYYCPHHPSVGEAPYRLDCNCRKPKPGLINAASANLGVDIAASWMVGDRYSDVVMARNAGLRSALVLTGYGLGEWEYQRSSWKFKPDVMAENLLEAVKKIVNSYSLRIE